MSSRSKLRVIQWATGGVGKAAIECVLNHPQLELVGCWVHSADKNGLDVGRITGLGELGVTATSSIDDLLALDADCVMYSPLVPNDDEVVAILRSGKNVVTPVGWVYPDLTLPRHKAVADAAVESGVTLHGSGIHPGGITERFPLMVSALSSASRTCAPRSSPTSAPTTPPTWSATSWDSAAPPRRPCEGPWPACSRQASNSRYEWSPTTWDFASTPTSGPFRRSRSRRPTIDYDPVPDHTGTVAARRFRWQALVDGEPVIEAAVNWLMGEENLDPALGFRRDRRAV